MKVVLLNFWRYKELLKLLVIRDVKLKYKRSFLGLLWSLLNPLLMMVIISIVFSSLFRFDIVNFPAYLITGTIMFTFFSEATNMSMVSIIGNGSLIRKVYIPKYIFPLSKILSSFINLLFSLLAMILVLIFTKVKLTWILCLIPLPLIYFLIFTIGVGLILSTYAVFFRDLIHLYGVVLLALNYLTPIFYPENIIPIKYQFLLKVNPLYYFIKLFRDVVLYGKLPSLQLNMICLAISLLALFIGTIVFYRKQDHFIHSI